MCVHDVLGKGLVLTLCPLGPGHDCPHSASSVEVALAAILSVTLAPGFEIDSVFLILLISVHC